MELEDEGQKIALDRVPCQFCSRKFVPESLAKHAKVCEKTLHKKRKTFDSAKQRIQGTELAEFIPTTVHKKEPMSSSHSRERLAPLIKNIDTAHHVPRKINKVTSPISKSSNHEKCPYCDRSFGPKAFDRHIEWCKEQSIRINLKSTATQEAKERLEARIKYRAPSFKSKRSITREKYSPKTSVQENHNFFHNRNEARKDKDEGFSRPFDLEPRSNISDNKKSKETKETNFIRQNVLRCSYKNKLPKKPETKVEKDNLNGNFQNKKADYNAIQNWISANGTKIKPAPPTPKMSTNVVNKPLINAMYDNYNPYILAEHQMKELLKDVNANVETQPLNQTFTVAKLDTSNTPLPIKDEKWNNFNNKENISSHNGPVKTISCQTDAPEKHFKTSPTSAFSKYTNGSTEFVNRTPTPIPHFDYDKSDDQTYVLPPITTKQEAPVQTNHDTNMNRYPLISLSNLSLCSSVSIDIPEDRNKMCKSAEKPRNENEIPVLQRSVSAYNADKTNKNTVKNNLKMEHLLYGNKESKDANTTYTTNTAYPSKYDEKLEKLNSLLDGENFDLLNSFTEFENVLNHTIFDDTFTVDSDPSNKKNLKLERGDSMVSKMSIDSAYNSLNRKSPALSESHKYYGKTSTPETDTLKSSTLSLTSDFQESSSQQNNKLSKFCHECGARYPLDIAKFCCECGVRRLVL